ncbi:MAG: UrcA family protein [Hyphomonadaceae bacterium]
MIGKSPLKQAGLAVIVGAAMTLSAAPAFALDDDITVIAPVHRHVERSASGMPVETVRMSSIVSARDLDLRYDRDVNEFYRRIDYTARETCAMLTRLSGETPLTTDAQCVRDAKRDARPQAEAIVARVRY